MSNSVKLTTSSKFTDATRQYKARLIANGGSISESSLRILDNYLVKPLQSSGLWGQLKRLNPCIGINLLASATPLIYLSGSAYDTATSMTDGDYSEATGWVTDGSSKYITTGYTPSEATGGMSAYLRTTQPNSATTQYTLLGAMTSAFTQTFRITANVSAAGVVTSANVQGIWGGGSSISGCGTASGGMTSGFWHTTRTTSSLLRMYKNGAQVASTTTSTTPATASAPLVIMARDVQTTGIGSYLNASSAVAGYCVDTGLSTADANTLYWIWQRFQASMNRAV